MFRLWGRIFSEGKLVRDYVAECADYSKSRTAMVMEGVREICHDFDLPEPIWLENNIRDFQRRSKVRFSRDNFIEEIDFYYLELQEIEE